MTILLLILGAIGHAVFWAMLVNRLHALGIRRCWIDLATDFCGVALVAIPLAIAWLLWFRGQNAETTGWEIATWSYVSVAACFGLFAALQRWRLAHHAERRGVVLANHTRQIDLRSKAKGPLTAPGIPTWLSRLPGNQVLDIHLHEEQLAIPRLSKEHEGLRIVHLTDLHMSGRITKAYFVEVVRQVNDLQPDLIALTGDLVERDACLDWIPETLGQLRASGGVFYVRGNHDKRVTQPKLREALTQAGLIYVGDSWQEVTVRNTPLVLAGNELPWFSPAADWSDCPPHDEKGLPIRILLAHTPDHLRWAEANDVDLMLAGHNHGGQVCLPRFGPLLAPSRFGTRYASGAFRSGKTILHVSRGTSSLTPIRWNCPPEIALLVLRAGA